MNKEKLLKSNKDKFLLIKTIYEVQQINNNNRKVDNIFFSYR